MATILIPTRNRPRSLAAVLGHLAANYPGTKVFIADGSTDEFRKENPRVVASTAEKLDVTLRQYPEKMPMLDRVLEALSIVDDRFVTFGADDDFLNVALFNEGERYLLANPLCSLAMGYRINLTYSESSVVNATLFHAFPIEFHGPLARMKYFSEWSYATTYSISRREHLISRYSFIYNLPVVYGFMDFVMGIYDLAKGRIKVFNDIGCISTKVHFENYVRSNNLLSFIHQSAEVLRVQELIHDVLVRYGRLSYSRAEKESRRLVHRRIGELTGCKLPNMFNFFQSAHYQDPIVQNQVQTFNSVFVPNTSANHKYWNSIMMAYQYFTSIVRDLHPVQSSNTGTLNDSFSSTRSYLPDENTTSKCLPGIDRCNQVPSQLDIQFPRHEIEQEQLSFGKTLDAATLLEI